MHPTGIHFKNNILESRFVRKKNKTRMHSRMRTISGEGVSARGRGSVSTRGLGEVGVWGVCLGGCLPRGYLPGGVFPGCTPPRPRGRHITFLKLLLQTVERKNTIVAKKRKDIGSKLRCLPGVEMINTTIFFH